MRFLRHPALAMIPMEASGAASWIDVANRTASAASAAQSWRTSAAEQPPSGHFSGFAETRPDPGSTCSLIELTVSRTIGDER